MLQTTLDEVLVRASLSLLQLCQKILQVFGIELMIDEIISAAESLHGQAHVTPILSSSTLNRRLGAEILFKCENFQKVGAFKFRGAYNAISHLSKAEKHRGVITYSSGNHGQAIAYIGQQLDLKTVVVMPMNAASNKVTATKEYGAEVVLFDPRQTCREKVTATLQESHGLTLIPPFDHVQVIAGQGTAALEFLKATRLDSLLVPCGGGGLLSGSAIAAKHLYPDCKVIGVEPELADDATRSFRSGILQTVDNPQTIADGTRTTSLGSLSFPLILKHVDDMQTVSESAIIEAVAFLFYRMKLVVEPSGALGLAALLSGGVKANGRVGVILSGGNIEGAMMSYILRTADSSKEEFTE
jgi:threonine dehydratase